MRTSGRQRGLPVGDAEGVVLPCLQTQLVQPTQSIYLYLKIGPVHWHDRTWAVLRYDTSAYMYTGTYLRLYLHCPFLFTAPKNMEGKCRLRIRLLLEFNSFSCPDNSTGSDSLSPMSTVRNNNQILPKKDNGREKCS
jgi:hypothetical protein